MRGLRVPLAWECEAPMMIVELVLLSIVPQSIPLSEEDDEDFAKHLNLNCIINIHLYILMITIIIYEDSLCSYI